MPEESKEVLDEIARLFEELKTRNDDRIKDSETRNGEVSAELQAKVDKVNEDIELLRKAFNDYEKRMNRPTFDMEGRQIETLTDEQRTHNDAFVKFLRHGAPAAGAANWSPEEVRALAGTSDTDGGIFIPPTFESGIIMNAYDMAEIRPIANVGTTGRDTVIFPSLSKPAVSWGRKAIAITEQDLSSGGKRMEVFFLQALTAISIDTLDDAEANIVSEMTSGFSMAIAEAEDDAFAIGAGDDSPSGIASNVTVQANYQPTGVADNIFNASNNGTDAMLLAEYKIKKTYRRNANWAMNSTTESKVRTLKDGQGRYMWQPSLQIGKPPTFDGFGLINPEGMADIAAGAFPMIFGDFQQYKIRDRSGMSVQRLVEKYAEYAQIGFLIRRRLGGMLVLPEAFSCIKVAAS